MRKKTQRMFDMATLTLLGPTPTEWMDTNNPTIVVDLKVPRRVKDYVEKFRREFSGKDGERFLDLLLSDLVIMGLKAEAKRMAEEGLIDLPVKDGSQ